MVGSPSSSHNTEAAILARLIRAGEHNLSQGAAEFLLSIHFSDRDIERMNELSELAREGKLSPAQGVELDGYIHVDNLLSLMQSRARLALNKSAGAES
jgi:hypothetical protein